jgi:hypothetical protein
MMPPKTKKSKKKKSSRKNAESTPEAPKPVAKIIAAEPVQPQLAEDGKLPTLSLIDDEDQPKDPEDAMSKNPAILGIVVCGSILLSCLMLMLAGQTTEKKKQAVEIAQEEIRQFYEAKPEEEPKPYQVDLRDAQVAHSRGDHWAEVRAYQRVMRRFTSEDRNQFRGVTGSPTWDTELQELVSTLLTEARRLAKKTSR